jgi:hypothetical protein
MGGARIQQTLSASGYVMRFSSTVLLLACLAFSILQRDAKCVSVSHAIISCMISCVMTRKIVAMGDELLFGGED